MKTERGLAPILLVLILAALVGGYFVYQKPKTVINLQGYSGPPPEKISVLKSNDECKDNQQLCNNLTKIFQSMNSHNYSSLLDIQKATEKDCITGSLSASICQGAQEGEKRRGYAIGAQDSEFDIASGNIYISKISEYVKSNTPFNYEEAVISTNRASISYVNLATKRFLIFNLQPDGNAWKITNTILGVDSKAYLKTYYPTLE